MDVVGVYRCMGVYKCMCVYGSMGVYGRLWGSLVSKGVFIGFRVSVGFFGCGFLLWVFGCLSVYMGVMGADQCLWVSELGKIVMKNYSLQITWSNCN